VDVVTADGQGNRVEPFPETARSTPVSGELGRILDILEEAFPDASKVTFEFDGRLHVHIDLRAREQLGIVEERLPYLGGGRLFSDLRRGKTPNHAFLQRISALVAR